MSANSFGSGASEGNDFQQAFESMTYGAWQVPQKTLPAAKPAPAIPARVGASGPIVSTGGTGGGIEPPLTETAYSDRTWYATRSTTTIDGLFTEAWQPLKSIKFLDVGANEVPFNLKDAP